MTGSVPALQTKIARLRPRVACFIGKGIWLHFERALTLLKGDVPGNMTAGVGEDPLLDAQAQGHVPVASKDERSAYFHLVGDHTAAIEWPAKAEPERRFDFCGIGESEKIGSDVSFTQNTDSISIVEEAMDTMPAPPSSPHSTTRRGGVSSAPRPASKKTKVPPARAFAYGLQPFKAIHNTVPHVRDFFPWGYIKISV